jgi:hypothetical protein
MTDYMFEVKLVAVVRVRALEESLARRVLPSVLGSPSTAEISLANETHAGIGWNATLIAVDFSIDENAALFEIDGKRVKRRRR